MDLQIKDYIIYILGEPKSFRENMYKIVEGAPSTLTISGGTFIGVFKSTFPIDELENTINEWTTLDIPFAFILHEITEDNMRITMQSEKLFKHLFGKIGLEPKMDFNEIKPPKGKPNRVQQPSKKYIPTLDDLLTKIKEVGFDSLSETERELLDEYSSQ